MTTHTHCSVKVYESGMVSGRACMGRVRVERDGKPYCAAHDPERVKARRDEKRELDTIEDAIRGAYYSIRRLQGNVVDAVLRNVAPDGVRLIRDELLAEHMRLAEAESKWRAAGGKTLSSLTLDAGRGIVWPGKEAAEPK